MMEVKFEGQISGMSQVELTRKQREEIEKRGIEQMHSYSNGYMMPDVFSLSLLSRR